MTIDEAISVLHKLKPTIRREDGKSTTHILETIALDLAIKELEQEPCEDCISRADALRVAKNEYLRGWHNALCKALSEKYLIHCEEGNFSVIQEETITGLGLSMDCAVGKDVESYMNDLPSVTPARKKEEWIPCSERLPEDDKKQYIVQKTNGSIDILGFTKDAYKLDRYDFAEYKGKNKQLFYKYDSEYGYIEWKCEAWMPLPEPYNAESEDKHGLF